MLSWIPVKDAERYAVAISQFSSPGPGRIQFAIGAALHTLQRCGDWYYGYALNNRAFRGVFPCAFVRVKKCIVEKTGRGPGTVTPRENPLVAEITSVLREWGQIWKNLYKSRDPNLEDVAEKMRELIRYRRKIIGGTLPTDELREVKRHVTATIDSGNHLLGLDLVVRDDQGNILNPDLTSAIELYRHHERATRRIEGGTAEQGLKPAAAAAPHYHSHCVYVTVANCVCRLEEEVEIALFICDATDISKLKVMTETYIVTWKEGLQENMEQISNLRVLFTDLSNSDIKLERVFLAAYLVAVGHSNSKNTPYNGRRSSQVPQHKPLKRQVEQCRRPFGAAAISLVPCFTAGEQHEAGKDQFMPFVPCGDKDSLEDTLRKLLKDQGRDHKGQGLWVTYRMVHGEKEQHPHLAKLAQARRRGFPDVILPTDVRNDLYLTLVGGEFSRGANKVQDRNVEVTVRVCDHDGAVRPDVIQAGAGRPFTEEYRSVVYWHESRPRWMETFKVVLPIEGDFNSHLRFTFKHRSANEVKDKSEKPFGLAYVNLLQGNGTTLRNTKHDLNVYKVDSKRFDESDTSYLFLPALRAEVEQGTRPASGPFQLSLRDSFTLESLTCSTKLTQDEKLLGLLKWSSNASSLKDCLSRLELIDKEEIVKFLRDSLDALFHILIHYEDSDMYDRDVFNALVTIISSVTTERRYQRFQQVLDAYLQSAFSATIVDRKLMGVLQNYLDDIKNPESQILLHRALGCLRYVFKFIIKSRQLYIKMNGSGDASFEEQIQRLLRSFTMLVLDRDIDLVQNMVLQQLPTTVDDLVSVCNPVRLSETMAELVSLLSRSELSEQKLAVISRLVGSRLFQRAECRHVLLPEVVRAVGQTFDLHQQQLRQCIEIVSDALDVLWRQHGERSATTADVGVITLELLRKVIKTVIGVDRDDPLVCGLVAVLISMLRQMERHHYDRYMEQFDDVTDQLHFIQEILMVFRDLISKCVYPAFWCEMIMLQNSVLLKSLRLFSHTIRGHFLDPFEHQIWNNFFHCAISFLTQSPLQLESFSASKRSRLLARYKDMRKSTAKEIKTMWISLGQHKISFVPSLVGPFLDMTLVPDPELRAMTIPLFFDMMQCEFYAPVQPGVEYNETKRQACPSKCNFQDFEHEMINKLDHLVEGGRGDGQYLEVFKEKMLDLCRQHNSMRDQGVRFVTTVTDLMERLLEYRAIMRDENEENKMSCTVNLLHFYHNIDCQEMYIRYLYKLYNLHRKAKNFIEAGFTLKLHAEQLQWSDEPLPSLLRPPDELPSSYRSLETHRAVKEALYHDIINHFDEGNLWEASLALCKELAREYEEATFEYHKLSELHTRMAQLYNKILQEIRPRPGYFRVAFYGRGFPAFLRNKVYIYRGRGYERLTDFQARVQGTFPKAELMDSLSPPGPDITESLQQYLQINSVDPDMEANNRFSGKPVTEKIVQYYRVNDVDRFVYSRRTHRGTKDPENPFASMWLERTVMRTTAKLPGILSWFPVKTTQTYDVTPLEHAVETMTLKNRQLRELILSNRSDSSLPLNPLTQMLSGIIDAAVMGGTTNYETFFSAEYLEENPDDMLNVEKLKVLIAKQIPLLEAGLETHGQRAPDSIQPLQKHLELLFEARKASIQSKFGVQESDLPYHQPAVAMRHARPSLSDWERQESIASDLSFSPGQSNGGAPTLTRSLMNLNFGGGGTLKHQKSTGSIPRTQTIFYSYKPPAACAAAAAAASSSPVRPRDRRAQEERRREAKRGSVSSTVSDASTIIELTEELVPARPLRSDVERERRLTRPLSGQLRHSPSTSTLSSRDSVGLTLEDEESNLPPPLPAKQNRMLSVQVEPEENGWRARSPSSQELTPTAASPRSSPSESLDLPPDEPPPPPPSAVPPPPPPKPAYRPPTVSDDDLL